MKKIIYLFLLPLIINAQNTISSDINSKKLVFSFQSGAKIYSGNMLLEDKGFTREGLFFSFNFFTQKEITKKINVIAKSSFVLSNAIAKDISVNIPEIEIDFVTRIPNILSANIKYSVTINKQINKYLNHGLALECRLFPLFYKKGRITNASLHSFGGYISSEENGSLPDLEKATQISYRINYLFNDRTSINALVYLCSDLSIDDYNITPLYPGLSFSFEKTINPDFRAPWLREANK